MLKLRLADASNDRGHYFMRAYPSPVWYFAVSVSYQHKG